MDVRALSERNAPGVLMSDETLHLTAIEQAALVRSGQITAREMVEASLGAIEGRDAGLGAFVTICAERALDEADRVASGDPRPLCGVPIGIKDLFFATEGIPTTHGSAAFDACVPDHDSAHIRRMRGAGAIIVGKTNTPELGMRPVTENERFGPTRNPWDMTLSPGGSSGGSAAAVASDLVALADGSDFGGSIRIPASCCGLVGLKPGMGRIPIGPDFADVGAGVMSSGVLTRTVADTALALDVMAGYAAGERRVAAPPPVSFTEAAAGDPGRLRVRVALTAPHGVPVDPEPRFAAEHVAAALSDLGHDVAEGTPGWDDEGFQPNWQVFTTGSMQHLIRTLERAQGHAVDPAGFEPATRSWFLEVPHGSAVDHLEASEGLWAFARRLLEGWRDDEVLVTPTLTRLPATIGSAAQPGVTNDAARFSALLRIWNVTGQPAISIPAHRSAGGVPVGVQIVGPPGRDDLVISVAAQLERELRWPTAATP